MSLQARSLAVLLLGVLCMAFSPETPGERAVELLLRLSDSAPTTDGGYRTEDVAIPVGGEAVRGRVYRPDDPLGQTMVVVHGVHFEGIDEARLSRFAGELARLGYHVVTPALDDLADYRITAHGVDVVASTVRYVDTAGLPRPDAVGLVGISFGGGLSLVAAARPEVSERLRYVASIGGHHDLGRVLRFFLENRIETPEGVEPLPAHEYGTAVLTYGALDEIAPPEDRKVLRIVFRQWLSGQRDLARRQAGNLTTRRGRRIFQYLTEGTLARLRPELEAWLDEKRAALAALSPAGKLAAIPVPVYLLHGKTDRVIPPSELSWAEQELVGRPHAALTTSLVEHVMPDRPSSTWEKLLLVDLMGKLL
jgi:pimeloyl-ACP methyl ester carboxylesterase